ncbi:MULTISPECIES: WXG100 family type VII secretion target [unclassified Streptomyces]|uniref:WXG100 family type VII secretion target n=1 Tax=unclassified Streptomyces TaxID=2593676 RepID=UPI000DC7A8D8|nr:MULTISPECIES: WXG100 family type VII secretion target [unclassified Streptomyces]AWZ05307.1 WXG100 family type VII secretion target [Streptomyces sp. ICC4]AWZ11445.1 WXG100 family type VII secretion target [Streptomyces sp. ICC1]
MSDFYSNKTDGVIHVQYQHVDRAAEDMRMQTTAIQNTVKALNEELAGLRGAWQGQDAAVYGQKQTDWNTASDGLGAILAKHSELLNMISEIYKKHENRSADQWNNVRIR